MARTPDGLWVGVQGPAADGLARLERRADGSEGWIRVEPLGDNVPFGTHALAVGADGTLWALLVVGTDGPVLGRMKGAPASPICCTPVLACFRDGAWDGWAGEDGLPMEPSVWWSGADSHWLSAGVAADGTLWSGGGPGGPIPFDGTTFHTLGTLLSGDTGFASTNSMAIDPDGLIWAIVSSERGGRDRDELIIIDPAMLD